MKYLETIFGKIIWALLTVIAYTAWNYFKKSWDIDMWFIFIMLVVNTFILMIYVDYKNNQSSNNIKDIKEILKKVYSGFSNLQDSFISCTLNKQAKGKIIDIYKNEIHQKHEGIFSAIDKLQKNPIKNPLSYDDLEKLKTYINRIENNELLNINEATEFNSLSKEFLNDINQKEPKFGFEALLVSALAGFILGALLSDDKK